MTFAYWIQKHDDAERVASALVPDLIRAFFALNPAPILRHCG